ncbi:MAG TPA: hypothetical protein VN132_08015 [Bdellovibrio sp.]|nr:hypothetical protein [Bdellovibrio sp.]
MNLSRTISSSFLVLIIAAASVFGCAKKSSTTAASDGTFTASDIVKSWTSTCTASTDSVLGTSYFQNKLNLYSDGTFSFTEYMYVSPNPATLAPCSSLNFIVIMSVGGVYSVGSLVSGSTTLQDLTFTVTVNSSSPDLMIIGGTYTPSVTTTQNIFNNDCGGTSPYCTLAGTCTNNGSYASGAHASSKNMTCQNYTFPNVGTNVIYNIGSYDSTNKVLTLGANTTGVPGVFSQGSLPTTATIDYQ